MDYAIYNRRSEGGFRVLHQGDYKTMAYADFKNIPRRYECFQGYDNSDEGLKAFHDEFLVWQRELATNPVFKLNWFNFYTNGLAVKNTFIHMLNGNKALWNSLPPIDDTEARYMEGCFNAGITMLYGEKDKEYTCYGYDMTGFYPAIMAEDNFKLPAGKGKEVYINRIAEPVQLGYYYCEISSPHPDFRKVFATSPDHYYTSYCVAFALAHQETYNITLRMLEREYNAYVYDKSILGSALFKKWYMTLSNIKKILPKNKLVKHMMSSLWGQLSAFKKVYVPEQSIGHYDLETHTIEDMSMTSHEGGTEQPYYTLKKNGDLYKHNARLKAFITSYGRCKIARVAMRSIKEVICIQTDGIVFSFPPLWIGEVEGLRADSKTTGCIRWQNAKKKTVRADLT